MTSRQFCPAQSWPSGGPTQPIHPERPSHVSRPPSWPGGEGEYAPRTPPEEMDRRPKNNLQPCPGARMIARVGSEAIFESEIIGDVNQLIEKHKDKIPAGQLEAQRELLIQQKLKGYIESKLILLDAKRTIPAEGWTRVQEQLEKEFEERQLEKMIESAGVSNRHELDRKLRSFGTSLEQEKRSFCDRVLAQQWIQQQIKRDEEITIDRMIGYYHEHIEEYTHPARARWEELMVGFADHPSKEAARDALARLGNQVLLGGMPFAEAAKRGSDGPTASEGGVRSWTTKGSLVCKELEKALFSLPIGQLSPIIEGPAGWHIVRVIEREEQRVTPFRDAQVEIREKINRRRMEKQFKEYMAKLEAQTPVWTIFDEADNRTMISRRPGQIN
ncbi:MAG: peptidylprolyl isomerase [Pirellulales bacterium]|nr:peptidylprolyl isomerase [Pirellulales bacterium]